VRYLALVELGDCLCMFLNRVDREVIHEERYDAGIMWIISHKS